eukprot:3667907-Amphidinium_carterae.1
MCMCKSRPPQKLGHARVASSKGRPVKPRDDAHSNESSPARGLVCGVSVCAANHPGNWGFLHHENHKGLEREESLVLSSSPLEAHASRVSQSRRGLGPVLSVSQGKLAPTPLVPKKEGAPPSEFLHQGE